MATSLVVLLDIDPDQVNQFTDIVRAHGKNSIAIEDGCLSFQVMHPQDEPNKVILVEVYANDAALESHWQSSHMKAYLEKVGDMIQNRQRYRCTV